MDDAASHPLVSLLRASFSVTFWILAWARTLIAFATITVPRLIYAILSYSLTLRLDFTSLAFIFFVSGIALSFFVRYRYLNSYATLKEVPLGKPDVQELHPDVGIEPPQPFHNYLDEFLSAIRVFGFLEKPVFHELARHLQTRRLIAGDTLSLDQDKNFYCVVDGMVQVFTQTGESPSEQDGAWADEELNGYQLLNEVGSGGTLSSLFTILSLFTEDVTLAWPDDEQQHTTPSDPLSRSRANSDVSNLDLESSPSGTPGIRRRRNSVSSSGSTVQGTDATNTDFESRPILSPRTSSGAYSSASRTSTPAHGQTQRPPLSNARSHRSTLPSGLDGTLARATVDTTLAVIPAEAFRRLTSKFPKSSAHIIQVILTRFSRVTFNAAHKYLGLTTELIRTEKSINDLACHPLPASFYEGGGMQQLRQRFAPDFNDGSDDDESSGTETDYFGITPTSEYNSGLGSVRTPNAQNGHTKSSAQTHFTTSPRDSPTTVFRRRSQVHAGDLLSMTGSGSDGYRPIHRTLSSLTTPSIPRSDGLQRPNIGIQQRMDPDGLGSRQSSDFDLRDEVMDCIAKSIGLIQPPMSGSGSLEASPSATPSEGPPGSSTSFMGRSPAMFNTSFGSLSFLQTADDASSMTGGSSAMGSGYSAPLENEVEILFFHGGDTLVRAGERDAGLFYVIEGFLDVCIPAEESTSKQKTPETLFPAQTPGAGKRQAADPQTQSQKQNKGSKFLFSVKTGGIAGYLASLSGIASYVDIRAKTDVYVGFLPHSALERLLEKRPIVLLTLAKRLISLLSPLVLQIDSSLDWMQVNAGQVLWRPGEPSDSFYIVINGRLRDLAEKEDGGVNIVGEYGQGDTVGELDVITSSTRTTTLHAIRDTELARMPLTLFNAISVRHPKTTVQLLRMIATRVREKARTPTSAVDLGSNFNLKTVAIIPAARNVPVAAFAKKLQSALEDNGAPTSYLTQASVASHLGRHAFTKMGKLKVAGWLADLEQRYRIVLYVADSSVSSPWTQTCIRQADSILVVGMGDDPSIGEYERLLLSTKTTARKELVLLHPDRYVTPGSTREWLKIRPWVHAHFHAELPGILMPKATPILHDPAAVIALKNLKNKVQNRIEKYRGSRSSPTPRRPTHSNDFARLARRLCGKSIGVVLGGGGARGLSHLGVIRALEEHGVPIDQIGGTSIGSFVSGLYAREGDLLSSVGRAKQFSSRMGNVWRVLSDVTYPIVAYTTGHEFNRAIYKSFYDLHIEDMWLPYFCNTTNILTSHMEVHDSGYAWRYIRASMTLVGLLPPLCDNGNVLVDGGYIDNLPVSTMVSRGASVVFAVDVGAVDDTSPRNFGDSVSGWWLLINRLNPFASINTVPPITEIQSRLAYVSSVKTLEDAKVMAGCFYMALPVQDYGTLQFNKFQEIVDLGYKAAVTMVEAWEAEGKLPSGYEDGFKGVDKKKKTKGRSLRRNSI